MKIKVFLLSILVAVSIIDHQLHASSAAPARTPPAARSLTQAWIGESWKKPNRETLPLLALSGTTLAAALVGGGLAAKKIVRLCARLKDKSLSRLNRQKTYTTLAKWIAVACGTGAAALAGGYGVLKTGKINTLYRTAQPAIPGAPQPAQQATQPSIIQRQKTYENILASTGTPNALRYSLHLADAWHDDLVAEDQEVKPETLVADSTVPLGRIILEPNHFTSETVRGYEEIYRNTARLTKTFIAFGENDVDAEKTAGNQRSHSGGQAGCFRPQTGQTGIQSPIGRGVITTFYKKDRNTLAKTSFRARDVQESLKRIIDEIKRGNDVVLPVNSKGVVTIGTGISNASDDFKEKLAAWFAEFIAHNTSLVRKHKRVVTPSP